MLELLGNNTWAVYLVALVSLSVIRNFTQKNIDGTIVCFTIAFVLSGVHKVLSEAIITFNLADESLFLFYTAIFLVSFAWLCTLERLKLYWSTLVLAILSLYLIVMVLVGVSANTYPDVLYNSYPYIIGVINIMIMLAAWYDRDRCDFNHINWHSLLPSHHNSKESH